MTRTVSPPSIPQSLARVRTMSRPWRRVASLIAGAQGPPLSSTSIGAAAGALVFRPLRGPELGDLELTASAFSVGLARRDVALSSVMAAAWCQRARLGSGVAPAGLVARPGAGSQVLACYTAIGVFTHPEW